MAPTDLLFIRRGCEGFFNAPAILIDSHFNGGFANACNISPCPSVQSFPIERIKSARQSLGVYIGHISFVIMAVCSRWNGGLGECALNSPTIFKPSKQEGFRNMKPFSPFRNSKIKIFKREDFVISLISRLLNSRSPSAVTRLIVSVIVDPIKRMLRAGLFSHIFQKVKERIHPAGANSNSASSIILISFISRIKATFSHAHPRIKFFPVTVVHYVNMAQLAILEKEAKWQIQI